MALTQTQVSQLYVTIFGKASEGSGNTYWQTAHADMTETANVMLSLDVAKTYFGTSLDSNQAFVEHIYLNTLSKTPTDDAAGITYWVGQLDSGASRGSVVAALIAAAVDAGSAGNAQDQFNNKVAASDYAAQNIETFTTDTAFQSYIKDVTHETSTLDAAKVLVDGAANPGTTFTLTTAADTFVGTANNDTFTGDSTTLTGNDVLLDQSSTDNDTFNLTLTTGNAGTDKISGIENINVNWDAFGTAAFDANGVTGAKINVTSSKLGFLGSATISNAGDNTIAAGEGAKGTLTVTGATTSIVNAGVATKVSATAAGTASTADTLTLNAGSATTQVTVADFDSATVDAGTATTISLTDDATGNTTAANTVDLTFGADATLANDVDKLTITAAAADKTLTLTNTAGGVTSIDVAGTNSMTIAVADAGAAINTGSTITKSSTDTLTYQSGNLTADADVSKIAADSFVFTGTVGNTVSFATGAKATLKVDGGAGSEYDVLTNSSADALTLNIGTDQAAIGTSNVETLTVNIDAPAVSNAADISIGTIAAGTNKVVLTGSNDIAITGVVVAKTIDASAMTSDLTITDQAGGDVDLTVEGGAGKNAVIFSATSNDSNISGKDGDDSVTFDTIGGDATAVLGNGKNTVSATALTNGNLVVVSGSGVDTVTATTNAGNVTLQLGDGDNVMGLTTNAGGNDTVNVVTGSGNDKLTLTGDTNTGDTINVTFGSGTDTLAFGANNTDISAGAVTMSGLSTISLLTGATTNVSNSLVSGNAISVSTSDGAAGSLGIVGTKAAGETFDASTLVIDQTITKAVTSVVITGNAGNDTITGTSIGDTIDVNGGNNTVTGGNGADAITLGGGNDTVVVSSGQSGITFASADTVSEFKVAGTDVLKLGTAATATNLNIAADVDLGTGADNTAFDAALVNANAAMNGTIIYSFHGNINGANDDHGFLFVDTDANGTADYAIKLTGATTSILAAGFAAADIVA